jgi:SM-20-related protein
VAEPLGQGEDAGTRLLDLDSLAAASARHDPFDFLTVAGLVRPEALEALNRDFPDARGPRNHEVGSLRYGPTFARLLEELGDPALARLLGQKLGVRDLAACPSNVTVRGFCQPSDGAIHTDHWSKVVTLLVYFNPDWPTEGGRLRLLRSADDLEDYAAEVVPAGGNAVAFRRSERSFHGHSRHEGERRVLQMSWIRPSRVARLLQRLARLGTHAMKRLGLHPD